MGLQREMAGVEEAHVASGMSRLNASAPGGRKNGSFLPHTARKRRLMGAEIVLEGRVERDIALVVAHQVELHVGGAGPDI